MCLFNTTITQISNLYTKYTLRAFSTLFVYIISLLIVIVPSDAQAPPTTSNTTIVRSPVDGNITIRFKSPPIGTCTTVFEKQKQYTGYVTLPPFTLAPVQQNYTVNTFFWFVEARTNPSTAPLTVWINGGRLLCITSIKQAYEISCSYPIDRFY